ncbi:MAG: TonB-dependent receptor [Flavobacteriaceae bacterium]|nr:TonB-dependent receptor [Flavobacteriaceae bacterium]
MNKNIIILLVGLFSIAVSAQRVKIEGVVKDSIGNSLEYANVIAVNQETKGLDAYGITGDKGQYKLTVDANKSYEVKITYLGYKAKSFVIDMKDQDVKRDIIMEEDSNALDEVEVVYEMPVSIKGDTIVYNSDSFTNGTEKKLGDVLKKLPGVEVNEDGEVEVEGKKVSKVMVEGKDFFDGDSKLATKNIPANALDKIEVLRNHSEVSALSGVTDNSDNVALNIKLKEGKKNFWFGDLTAGGGLSSEDEGLYIVHPKLFYYSPEYSINIITDFNNIGAIPFTIRDYFNFTGGFKNVTRKGGTTLQTSANQLGLSFLTNNRAERVVSQFGAANFSVSPNKTWTLSGFGIYSGNSTDLARVAQTTYIESNAVEDRVTDTEQRTDLGLLKLSSSYKPKTSVQFDYDAFLKVSRQEEMENVFVVSSEDPTNPDNIMTRDEQRPFSINQNINYYNSNSAKHVFAIEAQHLWQDEDPFYNAIREQQPFVSLPFDPTQSQFDINQERRIKTNRLDAKFDYYYVLNDRNNLNFTAGSILSRQDFNSHIYQILDNGTDLDFNDPEDNNDVQYNFSDLFLGVHYKFIAGKFTFNPGVSLHSYVGKNEQLGSEVKDELFALLPDAFIKLDFKKSENLRFNYSMTREFTNVNQLAEGFIFNNFNSLFAGNRNLESALYHNYSLNYFSFNMFNYTNIFGTITYNKKDDAIKNRTVIDGITQSSQPINSNLADETLTALGRFGRTFGKFKGSLRASLTYSKLNNIIRDDLGVEAFRTSESLVQNYRLSAATTFREAPNVEVGYNLTVNDFDNVTNANVFTTHSPFIKFDATIFKNFIFTADYTFNNFSDKNNTQENQYSFVDANLFYQKPESSWEFKLGVTNLLNTKDINEASFNQFFNTSSSYRVQPRYLVFSIKYDL